MTTVEFKFDLEQQVIALAGNKGVITGLYTDIGGNQYHVRTVGSR